jgi:arylsulfatase
MKHRTFLRKSLVTIGLCLGSLLSVFAAHPPNFVFFITDDICPDDLSIYGNPFVQTPNLDRIAKRGLVFDQAHNVISSCSPSRCAIITGRYPHNTGAPELHTPLPANQRTFVQALREAGYHTIISGKNHMGKAATLGFEVSSDSHPSGAENWQRHLRERPKDKPFFAWFASHDAHHPFQISAEAPVYDPKDLTVPPMMFDGPGTRRDLAGFYHEVSRTDYYAGLLWRELEAQELTTNTYFIYCADNGRPFPRCKTYLYDSGIKTPLLITGPGVKAGRTRSLVSSIDYSATFLELAGVAKPASVQGLSFVPVLRNPSATTREIVFAERNWHVYQLHERMVRFDDWLYIWNAWPERHNVSGESAWRGFFPAAGELWDAAESGKLNPAQLLLTQKPQPPEMLFQVSKDPNQFQNLVNAPEHAAVIRQARAMLAMWKQQTADSVPKNPTPDRGTLHESSERSTKRGDFPGADLGAAQVNHPGPQRVSTP